MNRKAIEDKITKALNDMGVPEASRSIRRSVPSVEVRCLIRGRVVDFSIISGTDEAYVNARLEEIAALKANLDTVVDLEERV